MLQFISVRIHLIFNLGTGVTTYSLHPGVIFTELGRHLPDYINNPVVQPILGALIYPFIKDIPHGVQTQICCAVDPGLAKETGNLLFQSATVSS